jgi:polysaccharide pyruvyl transferase WcaK-like protein
MRILVEPSAHHLLNLGDVAMLVATTERLNELWPDADVGVLTDSPSRLAEHCPNTIALPAYGSQLWFDLPFLGDAVHRRLPAPVGARLRSWEKGLRRARPHTAAKVIRARRRMKRLEYADLDIFLDWAFGADVVVVVGAGLLTDAFAPSAISVLELVELALERGAPTAMFGQGVGPLEDPELAAWCGHVLPRVDLIALRERLAGPPILRSLGVDESRVVTTGDDAVELAWRVPGPTASPVGLGISLRRARYSQVTDEALMRVGQLSRNVAETLGAALVPVPISRAPKERDAEVIAGVLGLSEPAAPEIVSVPELVTQVQRCRVVVTGSYHAGVFALAQGIPVVGLAHSGYYVDKFLGLSDQFGGLAPVVRLDDADFDKRLEDAVTRLWEDAEELRPLLCEAAAAQVERASATYRRFRDLVESRLSTARSALADPPTPT